ncbi:hypothetical protein [Cellulomonas sp. URHE0023]|uniref:hypothetical protein n=1 Tax=Cellulomonas sp. URHE0023 TaxID=1380354 RepID=UPI00048557F8|nr:hypothetical protein [Cellulomonas sp. URHE0023]
MADDLTGPQLAAVRHRISNASPDLTDPQVSVGAVVADLAVELDGAVLDAASLANLDRDLEHGPGMSDASVAERRALVALVCWLVLDPAVRSDPGIQEAAQARGGLSAWMLGLVATIPRQLSGLRPVGRWVEDDSAREELARAFLGAAGVLPAGESPSVANDRWLAVSTAYQRELLTAMAQEAARAEALAKALAEARAKEAAAHYVPS